MATRKSDGRNIDEHLLARMIAEQLGRDPEKDRRAAREISVSLERFATTVARELEALRGKVNALVEGMTGAPEETANTNGATQTAAASSDLPIASDTIVSVQIPRTLTNYLEKVLTPPLFRPFRMKSSRRQGPGFSDTVTLSGQQEIGAMLQLLHEHRSPSGWYTLATRVINELEDGIRRQANEPQGKRKGGSSR